MSDSMTTAELAEQEHQDALARIEAQKKLVRQGLIRQPEFTGPEWCYTWASDCDYGREHIQKTSPGDDMRSCYIRLKQIYFYMGRAYGRLSTTGKQSEQARAGLQEQILKYEMAASDEYDRIRDLEMQHRKTDEFMADYDAGSAGPAEDFVPPPETVPDAFEYQDNCRGFVYGEHSDTDTYRKVWYVATKNIHAASRLGGQLMKFRFNVNGEMQEHYAWRFEHGVTLSELLSEALKYSSLAREELEDYIQRTGGQGDCS